MRTVLLVLSLALNVWMGVALARLENYHYASQLGMCAEFLGPDLSQQIKRDTCLEGKETRTSMLWHTFYALSDTFRN
ncbi:hypothetical protein HFO26_20630 [Rhizobium leguminosarum]|uniref:hypothetical protein n=1 Tax=Rhizobium leguminosarum TaxID=384 RepID=UPI001C95113E|nr:hypothetical protein [Rhizobium leguminosarum]MBY5617279.1 hypothetical protein [Rhizobium leguminosarum]MBY5732665.1 hypothetical protein [Rhizobium leguminosarum]